MFVEKYRINSHLKELLQIESINGICKNVCQLKKYILFLYTEKC